MNRLLSLLLAALCLSFASAFTPVRPVSTTTATTALNVFGNKKSAAAKTEEDSKYWQGDWVCKDCGYIYNRVRTYERGCVCLEIIIGETPATNPLII